MKAFHRHQCKLITFFHCFSILCIFCLNNLHLIQLPNDLIINYFINLFSYTLNFTFNFASLPKKSIPLHFFFLWHFSNIGDLWQNLLAISESIWRANVLASSWISAVSCCVCFTAKHKTHIFSISHHTRSSIQLHLLIFVLITSTSSQLD